MTPSSALLSCTIVKTIMLFKEMVYVCEIDGEREEMFVLKEEGEDQSDSSHIVIVLKVVQVDDGFVRLREECWILKEGVFLDKRRSPHERLVMVVEVFVHLRCDEGIHFFEVFSVIDVDGLRMFLRVFNDTE